MPFLHEPNYDAILAELAKQTDRGAGIIVVSMVDEVLTEALKARLDLTVALSDKLFSYERNGPLANFSQKIDFAKAVGLITQNNTLTFI